MSRWLLLVLPFLAGCLDGGAAADATVPGLPPEIVWTALAVGEGPEPIAGFRATLPEDALVRAPASEGWMDVELRVVPTVHSLDHLFGFGTTVVAVFAVEEGVAQPLAFGVATPLTARVHVTPGLHGQVVFPPAPSIRLTLDGDAIGPSRELGIVVGQTWDAPLPAERRFGATIHLEQDRPTAPPDPVALRPLGTGDGFHAPLYVETRKTVWDLPVGLFGADVWSGDVLAREEPVLLDVRPTAAARRLTLESAFEAEAGFGAGAATYRTQAGAAQWVAELDFFGERFQSSGVVAGGPAASLPAGYAVKAEGAGGSRTRFVLESADADVATVLALAHIEFGATLGDLLGARLVADTWVGEAAGAPERRDDDLVLRGEGATLTLAGVFAGHSRE